MIAELAERIWRDPKKRAKVFTFIWVISLFMLVLGFLIIAWLLI